MNKMIQYDKFINENIEPENSDKLNKPIKEKKLMRIFISSRLLEILNKMIKTGDYQIKTVANRIIGLTKIDDELFDISYLDIQEGKNDSISYMPSARAWRSMSFENQEQANEEPNKDCPMWKGSGRQSLSAGKLINKLFDNFSDIAIEKFGNAYKAEISAIFIFDNFKVVKGEDIRFWYDDKNYAPTSGGGDLSQSCMRYGTGHQSGHESCQSYFDIYCNNPDKCGMLILTDFNNKLIGRAIVWFKLRKPVDQTFMDRIYTNNASDTELFKKYAVQQGWLYKYQQSAHDPSYIENGQRVQKSISLQIAPPKDYKKYPYMDTLKFYNPGTGRLASDQGNPVEGKRRIRLESGGGGYTTID